MNALIQKILIIMLVSFTSLSCKGTSNKDDIKKEEVITSEFLNEEWHFRQRESSELNLKPNGGVDCYFYPNGTFMTRSWIYGMSIGYIISDVGGIYQYNFENKELALKFIPDPAHLNKVFFTMRKLGQGSPESESSPEAKDTIIQLESCLLKIISVQDSTKTVEAYAIKENGEKIVFGTTTFKYKETASHELQFPHN